MRQIETSGFCVWRSHGSNATVPSPLRHHARCGVAQSDQAIGEFAVVLTEGSIEEDRCMAVAAANKARDTKLEIIRRFMGETSRPYSTVRAPCPA
jgi:hypothetical protein